MIDYKLGKIYKVVNDVNDIIYIGSTAQKLLCNRMRDHRARSKDASRTSVLYDAMREIGYEHFRILLVKPFSCDNKMELEAEEYNTISEMKGNGISLYNSIVDGKHSQETKIKCKTNRNFGGCVYFCKSKDAWSFRVKHKHPDVYFSKSFSVNKYGFDEAKALAEQERVNFNKAV